MNNNFLQPWSTNVPCIPVEDAGPKKIGSYYEVNYHSIDISFHIQINNEVPFFFSIPLCLSIFFIVCARHQDKNPNGVQRWDMKMLT